LAAKHGYGYYGLGGGFAQFYKTVADQVVFQFSIEVPSWRSVDISTSRIGSIAFARAPRGIVWDRMSAERTSAYTRFMIEHRLEFQANCFGDPPNFGLYQPGSERVPLEVLIHG
jgi:hypothetical protein